MVYLKSDNDWLKRGRQKAAVAQVLQRPMTPSEIWRAAQTLAPRIQLRDVWFILRQMQQRGIVTCYNPQELNGKVYAWATTTAGASTSTHWHRYSYVIRAKVRRVVLTELAHRPGQSAGQIRRQVNDRNPISLNAVIRGIRDLHARGFIRISGEGEKRGQKVYHLTTSGQRIADLVMKPTNFNESTTRSDSPNRFTTKLINRRFPVSG